MQESPADKAIRLRAEAMEEVAKAAEEMAKYYDKVGEPFASGAMEGFAEMIRTSLIPAPAEARAAVDAAAALRKE
jgi:hypothetical protein